MVISVTVATCRIGDLFTAPTGGELIAGGTLDRSAPVGSKALVLGKIPVDNTGNGVLTWKAKILGSSTWLSIQNPGGSSKSDSVRVMLNPAGLDTGTHEDSISITSDVGGAATVIVNWNIRPCDLTHIQSAGQVLSDTLTSKDCGALHRTDTQAQLFDFDGTQGDVKTILLAAGFKGFLALDTSRVAAAPALDSATNCLGDSTIPCLYYVHLPRTTTYYIEVTSATPADSGPFTIRLMQGGRPPNAPGSLDQRQFPDTTLAIPPNSSTGSTVVLRAVVSDSDLVDTLHIEAEVKDTSAGFSGSITGFSPPVLNGSAAYVTVSGLSDTKTYKWRVRAVDQTGVAGTWDTFPIPAFTVQTGHNPGLPTALNQYQSDGTTVIPLGNNTTGTTVIFKGQVTDIDPGNTIQLQVEVQSVSTNFTCPGATCTPSGSSAPATTGSTVSVSVGPLTGGVGYHWQAQAIDNTGRSSGWTSFGGNLESAPDFVVQVPPQRLAFVAQPQVDTSNRPIHPPVQVAVQDQNGNTITSFTGPVTMAIATNPGNGTLTGTNSVNAVAGVATFSNLIIDKAGTGYTLQASINNGTIFSPLSSPFNVVAGPATKLAFTGQPSNTPATSPITPAVVVTAQDAAGNTATSFTGNVTVNLAVNPPGNGILSGPTTVAAVAGQAQFGSLSIDKVANGYQLGATSAPLTPATSQAFNITNIGATHLTFSIQPTTTGAGVPINSGTGGVVVTAVDDVGQPVTSYTGPVTLTIGANPGGGTLTGGGAIPAVNGVAAFSNVSINKVGIGYTLNASGPPASGIASGTFNITPGPMSQLAFTVPPTNTTAGVAIPAVQVAAEDQFGNVVTTFTGNMTIAIASGPGGGTFTPTSTTTVAAVAGVAIFNNLHIRLAGTGYSLQASTTVPSLTSPASGFFNIIPAPAATLSFTTPPGNTTAGAAINAPGSVVVTARDSVANVATGFTSNVTMAIASGPGGTLTGTPTVAAALGVATFNNLRIRTPVGLYTLQASSVSPALTSPASGPFNIVTGPANRDTFIVQPTTTAVQAHIDSVAGGLVVWIVDSVGNLVTTATNTVTVQLSSNPTGAILGGNNSFPASGGIANFTDLTVSKIGTYTLAATTPSLINDISSSFTVVPGPAKSLVFKTPPTNTVAGSAISPPVQVAALDVVGDTATGFTGNVTLALNPSATLGGTNPVAAIAGIATFSNLTVQAAGTYTLIASTPPLPSGSVSNGTSSSFTVATGGVSASQSTISAAPNPITACKTGCSPGANTASTILVTAKDALGNPIAGATVTLSSTGTSANITQPVSATNASGQTTGTISDTTSGSQTVSAAITLSPNPPVSPSTPANLTVNPAAAAAVFFIRNPLSTTAGATINNPGTGIQVQVNDQFGNKVGTATNNVTLSILVPPSPAGGVLAGVPNPKAAVSGVATFSSLHIDQANTNYFLLATSAGLPTSDTSTAFNITAGVATQLSITTQPSTSAQSGIAIPQQPAVQLLDALNNPVNQSGVLVTAALATGSGSLTNSTATTNASGLATFSGLAINGVVGSYSLKFTTTSPSLTSPNSNSISLSAGTASKLGFFTQPVATTGGVAIPTTVQVEIEDASGNRVTSASATITMALGTNPKNGHLTGTTSAGTSSGVASFSNLVIDSAATGYRLSASGGGFTAGTSNTFDVTVGSATKLGFRIQPVSTTGGATLATVQVEVRDAGGNRVTSGNHNVSLAISTNPNSGTLSGTINNVATAAGLVSFTDLSIDSAGSGYILQASTGGLASGTSNPFNITVGAAAQLIFIVQPADPQSSGATVTPPVQVEVADLGGNRVTSSTATIAIDFGTNPGGNPLGGTLSKAAVAGLVSFDDLVITGAGTGYTLVATSSPLTGTGPSNPFTVN